MKKNILLIISFLIFIILVLNFKVSTQSSYANDTEDRIKNFTREIYIILENFPEVKIASLQQNGRVSRGLIINIEVYNSKKLLLYISEKLLKIGFIRKDKFLCRDLEYVDFSSDKLNDHNVILYWHYPDERCKPV